MLTIGSFAGSTEAKPSSVYISKLASLAAAAAAASPEPELSSAMLQYCPPQSTWQLAGILHQSEASPHEPQSSQLQHPASAASPEVPSAALSSPSSSPEPDPEPELESELGASLCSGPFAGSSSIEYEEYELTSVRTGISDGIFPSSSRNTMSELSSGFSSIPPTKDEYEPPATTASKGIRAPDVSDVISVGASVGEPSQLISSLSPSQLTPFPSAAVHATTRHSDRTAKRGIHEILICVTAGVSSQKKLEKKDRKKKEAV
jgi:hypothetical protein